MSSSDQTTKSIYEYSHQVETCPCGVCYTARVNSGIQTEYEKQKNETPAFNDQTKSKKKK